MGKKTWKDFERLVARVMGGKRNPVNGRGDEPDVIAGAYVIECKQWKRLPVQVEKALRQAEALADEDQLAVAIIGKNNHRWQDSLVVMRMGDFTAWFGTNKDGVNGGDDPVNIERE